MASKQKTISHQTLTGTADTPDAVVAKVLNSAGFHGYHVGRILDPSCGDGQFLMEVVRRIIKAHGPAPLVVSGLSRFDTLRGRLAGVEGWDIDPEAVEQCRQNLTKTVSEALGVELDFEWNLQVRDTLNVWENPPALGYDYIVGNPPYIRIQNLTIEQRKYLKDHYTFCSHGSSDIYLAFMEVGHNLLNVKGKCAFIVPNSWMYTAAGRPAREFFVENYNLVSIVNYKDEQLFPGVSTYSAIVTFRHRYVAKDEDACFIYAEKWRITGNFSYKPYSFHELEGKDIWGLNIDAPPWFRGPHWGRLRRSALA